MISACVFTVLLEHPASAVNQAIDNPPARRALMGLAMGFTAIGIICSPWGRRSGAHMNPAITLSYLSLGKINPPDAFFYIAAQFIGGVAGVQVAQWLIGMPVGHSAVNYAATLPGDFGAWAAFAAEIVISSGLFLAVLASSNHRVLSRWTPVVAGSLVALYITFEAPISGMSMNPARTLGSAVFASDWTGLWIYFTAPTAGMIFVAQAFRLVRGPQNVFCAKLHHHNKLRCIFRCNFGALHDGR
jgi:aquaporin Z